MTASPPELRAWVGDALVVASTASVSVFDAGFRTGAGVFETVRCYGAHPFRLDAHLDRAARGADVLGFDFPPRADLVAAIHATAAANLAAFDGADSALRLTITPGASGHDAPIGAPPEGAPTTVVTSHPLTDQTSAYRDGLTATAVPWSRELPEVKAVSYLSAAQARREAHRQGTDEALLTDRRGNVLEGSFSNVFAVIAGRLVTPPVDAGILAGVTRGVVLEVAAAAGIDVAERRLGLDELRSADEAFLTATTREVLPLVRVAGSRIGSGRPGPVTRALHEGYRSEVRSEIATSAGRSDAQSVGGPSGTTSTDDPVERRTSLQN